MSLPMIPFDAEKIKIHRVFQSQELDSYTNVPVTSEKIRAVIGDELRFDALPEDRPLVFGCLVNSIDGKLAYADKPGAFYVAGKNMLAGDGKDTDFWMLNTLRAVCDAAIIGGNSLATDADYSMHCMDADLTADRVKAGLPEIPLNIVMTLDAKDVPMDHALLKSTQVPSMLITSPDGAAHFRANFQGDYVEVTEKDDLDAIRAAMAKAGTGVLPVLVTGQGGFPDSVSALKILKQAGIHKLLIESPGYAHFLIGQKMMDNLWLNLSAVYIGGGDTMTMGKAGKGFSADAHPHAKILSIHLYNEYFAYLRYKLNYDYM